MTVTTDQDGNRWADDCSLCRGTRVNQCDRELECSWCRSVRYKYGNYFYPINDSNKHLFENKPPPEKDPLEDRIVKVLAKLGIIHINK